MIMLERLVRFDDSVYLLSWDLAQPLTVSQRVM